MYILYKYYILYIYIYIYKEKKSSLSYIRPKLQLNETFCLLYVNIYMNIYGQRTLSIC